MKKSHIYTRSGDSGTTTLIGGNHVKKCCLRIEAYGTVDELSAHIGLLCAMIKTHSNTDVCQLLWIQERLFDVGNYLAMPYNENKEKPRTVTIGSVQQLEGYIDELDSQLPVLHSFILPGGSITSAQCHVCRTVCRRVERLIVALAEESPICPNLLSFINRLSDFLFVYARSLNKMEGVDEISWRNDCD